MIGEKSAAVQEFWEKCRREHGIETTDYHALTLADPKYLDASIATLDLSDQPALIRARQKRGTAHLLLDFELNGTPRREVGDHWVILDYDMKPLFLVRITEVAVTPFEKVPQAFAEVEGEGDSSLKFWQDAHRAYFTRQCAFWGIPWREFYSTVCETWELVATAEE